MNIAAILKLALAWGGIFGPPLLLLLQQYQATHPSQLVALAVQMIGAGILQAHKPSK